MQFFGETGRPDRPLDAVLTVIGNDPGMEYGGYGINDVLARALRHDYDQATADSDRRSSRAGVPAGESTYGSTRSPSLSTPDPISRNRWMRWR